MADRPVPVPPGGRIGILGGGQLGRMLAMAAAKLGLRTHIYCPAGEAPAADVAWRTTRALYDDREALERFAEGVDVVTYEFENVPAETAEILESHCPVRPGRIALSAAQDRLTEKGFLRGIRIDTAPFRPVDSEKDLAEALADLGTPAILKTRRLGYDGKGQVLIRDADEAADAYAAIKGAPAILEGHVDFVCEISVIAARGLDKSLKTYVPVQNEHRNHVLSRTLVPARISDELALEGRRIAERIVEALDYVGVIGVEMFLIRDRDQHRLIVNEIAPRVHNSGHWTIEAAHTSQFEQHIRAVAGWPLGDTRRHSDAVMENLLGEDASAWADIAAEEGRSLHLYGKAELRDGRKMGHVTDLFPRGERPVYDEEEPLLVGGAARP